MITTVPGSEMIRTPDAAVKADAGALSAGAAGKRNLSRGLMDLSGAASEFTGAMMQHKQNVQRGIDAGIAADADVLMRETTASFQQSLRNRPDQDTWVKDFQDEAKSKQDAFISAHPKLTPKLRSDLSNGFKQWQSANSVEFGNKAELRSIERAKQGHLNQIEASAKAEDYLGVGAGIQSMVNTGLVFPEQATAIREKAYESIQHHAASHEILDNPVGAYELFSDKEKVAQKFNLLPPEVIDSYRREAYNASNEFQRKNLTGFQDRLLGGEKISNDEIIASVASKQLSPNAAKSLMIGMSRGAYTFGDLDFKDFKNKIAEANLGDEKSVEAWAHDAAIDISKLAPAFQPDAQKALFNKLDSHKKSAEKSEKSRDKEVFRMMDDLNKGGGFLPAIDVEEKTHWFRADEPAYVKPVDLTLSSWKSINTDPETRTVQDRFFVNAKTEMREWLGQNPDATVDDARKVAEKAMEPQTISQIKSMLAGKKTAAAATKLEIGQVYTDSSGNRATWTGKDWQEETK